MKCQIMETKDDDNWANFDDVDSSQSANNLSLHSDSFNTVNYSDNVNNHNGNSLFNEKPTRPTIPPRLSLGESLSSTGEIIKASKNNFSESKDKLFEENFKNTDLVFSDSSKNMQPASLPPPIPPRASETAYSAKDCELDLFDITSSNDVFTMNEKTVTEVKFDWIAFPDEDISTMTQILGIVLM